MNKFTVLIRREWMQHHRGWLLLMGLPPLIAVLALSFGQIVGLDETLPEAVMAATVAIGTLGALVLAWLAVLLQAPGLARRDQQDRSIEFWLSLPTSHAGSIGATVLTHGLLMPLLALGVGALASVLLGLVVVARLHGADAWFEMPWGVLLPVGLVMLARLALGLVLASLWLAPLLLTLMAASAWLKRWGLPVLVAAVGGGHLVLSNGYGIDTIGRFVGGVADNAVRALTWVDREGVAQRLDGADGAVEDHLAQLPQLALHDAGLALRGLVDGQFVVCVLLAAAAFGLLMLHRRRRS